MVIITSQEDLLKYIKGHTKRSEGKQKRKLELKKKYKTEILNSLKG